MYEEPRDMKQAEMIVISLDSIDQLIEPCPPSPFRKRQLREEAERFLVEHVTALPRQAPAKLLISLPHSEANDERKVVDAIHADFNFRRIEAEKHLAQTRRFGWRSLVIALLFLAAAMLAVQLMKRYLPPVALVSVVTEGLTVFAWVALWRPGELLLYEWYPFTRDARLFRKLEQCEVRFSYNNRQES
jgi:hypothetical protein